MIIIEKKAQLIIYFFICACVLSGGSLISIPLCSVALHFYAAAIGFGFFFGNIHYLANMLLIEFFGPSKLSGCFSMVYLAYTIASFTGNPLAGIVSRMTRFDGAEFFFTGSSIVVAGLVMIPSLFVTTKRSAMLKRSETLHLDTTRRSDICNYKDYTEKVEISVNILDKETAYGAISIPV
ncbi:monocarboxylate transporter 2-like [Ylistrum balloti]|uniref:monocarboxylate transporter 2-like n=1 Tax=Ylistrum balloti TaxID=509963 RepID=UPI002905C54D|nr:monocarboxylate transporter 2-like [Ylistrum balloti]